MVPRLQVVTGRLEGKSQGRVQLFLCCFSLALGMLFSPFYLPLPSVTEGDQSPYADVQQSNVRQRC